jgi:endonuclease/exonuclease/phosphatase (EEP) superfamily protein YafD
MSPEQRDMMKFALLAIGIGLIALTVLSRVRSARWWIRSADFPRLQVAVLLALIALAHAVSFDGSSALDVGFGLALAGSLAYQCFRIAPYTPLAPRQVGNASPGDRSRSIRLLISNVLMDNRRAGDFVSLVRDTDPDLILAVETDGWWDERLRVLEPDYPHTVKRPQGNFYGMHLFSRLVLESVKLRFLVEEDIPSIRATVRLRSGDRVEFFGLHPRPPEPQQDTEERDAELLMVGREVKACGRPAIVAGDLNDVAWSNTTRLFQKVSGMLDPRRGRGMFNTFHADYPMFRWPLDHVFHHSAFTLVRLQRLRSIGSDHFPVLAELQLEPAIAAEQAAPEPDREDLEEARGRIAEGRAAE